MVDERVVTKKMETAYLILLVMSFIETTWNVLGGITVAHWVQVWMPEGLALGIVFAIHVLWRQWKQDRQSNGA